MTAPSSSAKVTATVNQLTVPLPPPQPKVKRRTSFASGLSQYVEAFDLVYENQRRNNSGEFTSQLLFQDPAPWSDELGGSVGQGLESILVPN